MNKQNTSKNSFGIMKAQEHLQRTSKLIPTAKERKKENNKERNKTTKKERKQ